MFAKTVPSSQATGPPLASSRWYNMYEVAIHIGIAVFSNFRICHEVVIRDPVTYTQINHTVIRLIVFNFKTIHRLYISRRHIYIKINPTKGFGYLTSCNQAAN
jgi:hypothetical protein